MVTFLGKFCGLFGKDRTEIRESEGLIRTTGLLTCGYETAETAGEQRINCYINKCIKLILLCLLKLFQPMALTAPHIISFVTCYR